MTGAFPLSLSVTKVAFKIEGGGVAFVGLHGVGIIQKRWMHEVRGERKKRKKNTEKKAAWSSRKKCLTLCVPTLGLTPSHSSMISA